MAIGPFVQPEEPVELLDMALVEQTLVAVADTYQAVALRIGSAYRAVALHILLAVGMIPACAGGSSGTAGFSHANHCRDYPNLALDVHQCGHELLLHVAGPLAERLGFLPAGLADEDLLVD